MPLTSLQDALRSAEQQRSGVGHFNFSETVVLKAVAAAARDLRAPVIVGVSEGEREFLGVRQAAALVKSIREEWDTAIFLNADHTHSLDKAVEAAQAGFDMVVFDASAQPFDENVKQTRAAVESLKSINPKIIVEGEIGFIGTSSEIHASRPTGLSPHSTPEEAKQFVEATGVDVLAPSVGTMHGMLPSMERGEEHKHLDVPRIAEIKRACGVFLTLHGGSGTDSSELVAGIQAGLTVVHINTELRVAWRKGLEDALAKHPGEVAPYRLLPGAYNSVIQVVRHYLQMFRRSSAAVA